MTEVNFHVNTPDKLGHACRLLRKAHASGARVVVTGAPDQLRRLDTDLWTFSALDFVPHCLASAVAPEVVAATPVVLAESVAGAPHLEVLVNLGPRVPEGFERFERLIELVSDEATDLAQGRQRWKHYAERGYEPRKHDMAARGAG